jgi:hypothetical protein
MDELHEFCRRVLGAGANADQAVADARATTTLGGRVELLAAAARACRARAGEDNGDGPVLDAAVGGDASLSASVATELEIATAKLPERHREALALRELLRLSHDQVARVMGVDAAAVAPLLARARLRLRDERRGTYAFPPGPSRCEDRDRALRSLARRQDSEPLTGDDDEWLLRHLGSCEECDQAHAAMLEASFCYRAWSVGERRSGTNGAAPDAPVPVSSLE